MASTIRSLAGVVLFMYSVSVIAATSISSESYELYKQLQHALISNKTTSPIPNFEVLADAFFPKQSAEPVCVLVKYNITGDSGDDVGKYSVDYLWTKNYMSRVITKLLFSYSQSGVTLKGFEWEQSCQFDSTANIVLETDLSNYSSDTIESSLRDLTSQLKAFADAQDIPKPSNSNRGYGVSWKEKEIHQLDFIVTIQIIILNIFIFSFSLASSNLLYSRLYDNIKGKKNPGYSLFWAVVTLSILWNVGPSWLILSRRDHAIFISLAVMLPLELLVVVIVKKKSKFPIPFIKSSDHAGGCIDYSHSFSRFIFTCARCFVSHAVQVMSLWSLLITFTFLMHYITSIMFSFYLDPLNSLVKLVFVKTVLICFVINVALLFTIDRFHMKCNERAMKKNVVSLVSVITVTSFFPILLFLVFVIGGIIFVDTSQGNSWKALFTLIPSFLLFFGSWFSRGLLFPDGVTDENNPGEEIVKDLEGKKPKSTGADKSPGTNRSPGGSGDTAVPINETTTLLPQTKQSDSSNVRSRVA